MERLSRDAYFLTIAWAASRRSTCRRRAVGAVVVDRRGRILSTGYNGSPEGYPHCEELCGAAVSLPCQWSVHAEINALLFADNREPDKTLYVTASPCRACALAIANAGVSRVVIAEPYRSDEGLKVLDRGGIPYEFLGIPDVEGRAP
jgi:dCMP deaminase